MGDVFTGNREYFSWIIATCISLIGVRFNEDQCFDSPTINCATFIVDVLMTCVSFMIARYKSYEISPGRAHWIETGIGW